jgi:superfamily II RNA helicase
MEHPFTFPLDPFQTEAISYLAKNENVLVTAKTGSGKTLIGEYQIWKSLKEGKRVFYTTPIKSLSNQKFHDLKKAYSGASVGIMTGDIKFCPQADIVIMTTEILRNLLYKPNTSDADLSLNNLDAVVFDEVHYINDPQRGSVWEECLVLLPPEIRLVLLSATLDSPQPFVDWLTDIKQVKCHLISTQYRVVPLIHTTEDGETLMEKDVFKMDTYRAWVRKYYNQQDELRKHKEKVKAREGDVVEKDVRVGSFIDRMNRLIAKMDKPALFFVFSRKMCEEYASKVTANLLTSSEGAEVHHIVKYHLHRHDLQKIESYHVLLALLTKGVAFHHSGMLPILKEIVEILFDKGFVKVLFATETFAVGINMPTKSVVFTSYRKVGDLGNNRMLRTSEYIQMAGRAGRRGKDDKGIVIYLPIREPEEPELVREMMCGRTATIESQMKFDYSYILATVGSGKTIDNQTYWNLQRQQEYQGYMEDIKELKQKIEQVKIEESFLKECEKKQELKSFIKKLGNAEKKKAEKELSQWDNSHMGPKWVVAWKSYSEISVLKSQIDIAEYHIQKLDEPYHQLRQRTKFLETLGFLTRDPIDRLTQKGELASLIHEGHPILMTELYTRNILKDEHAYEIASVLSCFLEQPHTEEIIPSTKYVQKLRDLKIGQSLDNPEYWNVTDYWVEVVLDWLGGIDFVCEKYGIEHGNFVRAMLKLANILREWVGMATLSQDTEMIEKLKDIESNLIRGFVVPDSLYLRI